MKNEIDLDQAFNITDIKSILYDEEDEEFYLLANRSGGIIGFYLMKFPVNDPLKLQNLTMWKHNLDIDDANMFIATGINDKKPYRELIVGYKTIFINTYTIVCKDLSDSAAAAVLYKHEAF